MITDFSQVPPATQDAFRTLRTNIYFSSADKEIRTIVVTSADPKEGKSTVSVHLAMAMAESGKKVLLFEADCRQPMIGNYLGIRPKVSWLHMLYEPEQKKNAIVPTNQKNLFFLDAEAQITHPVEIMSSKKFALMVETLSAEYDAIIFDTPPVGSFIEAAVLAERMDGTLLVINVGKVEVKREQQVVAQLKKANANILGAVLNGVRATHNYSGYYGHDGKRPKRSGSR